ncbi:MAG: hypothetical protein KGL67_00585 [Patescibacteria group bacterium]|nr:hypothetical protein [Patescibacteria group bacterium]
MIEIKDLLSKWNNTLLSEEVKTEYIKEVLEKVIKIKIKNTDIKIKDNTVYLNLKPIYKNEIFLNQEKIISLLTEKLGKKTPKNIR